MPSSGVNKMCDLLSTIHQLPSRHPLLGGGPSWMSTFNSVSFSGTSSWSHGRNKVNSC